MKAMRLIWQQDPSGCGVACVAMVAGISYTQAKRVLFPDITGGQKNFALNAYQLRDGLRSLGFQVGNKFVRVPKDIRELKFAAVLKANDQENGLWHAVVWDPRRLLILDPNTKNGHRKPTDRRLRIKSGLLIGGG